MNTNECSQIVVLSLGDLIGPGWDPAPLQAALGHLPDREATIIRSAYLGDQKQPDRVVALELGVERSRVTRVRNRALGSLRSELEGT